MDLLGIGTIVETVGKVAEHFITTDKEKMELELEGRRLDQANDLAQISVNTAEASSSSIFVAGWRPFVGWCCGFSMAYIGLFEPFCRFIAQVLFKYSGTFPQVDTTITMQVLFGLLGLAGMRTYEKQQGVAAGSK